ncbi:MAG: hypothetical protein Q8R92_16800 [Deltaproteobacteria bacterium]|nr:hypothetical protein [Deltaproteobacteria bacterium]
MAPTNPFDDPPPSQAERIIAKFGGVRNLMRALQRLDPGKHRDPVSIYRWTYSRERGGTGGLIPTAAIPDVMEAARLEGIFLSSDDFDPRRK